MKTSFRNRIWILLIVGYIAMIMVALYLNAKTTQSLASITINFVMFLIVGLVFFFSIFRFRILTDISVDLKNVEDGIKTDFEAHKVFLWNLYKTSDADLFKNEKLNNAYRSYLGEMRRLEIVSNGTYKCTIEDFINKEFVDSIAKKNLCNIVPGVMTGLGILGTFVGLSFGLKEFNTGSAAEISESIAPLMDGIKVAFHTSIYGIIFSLLYNFVLKKVFEEAYINLEGFIDAFNGYVTGDAQYDNESNTLKILSNMPSDISKKIAEILQPSLENINDTLKSYTSDITKIQSESLSMIVMQFIDEMNKSLGENFKRLGIVLNETSQQQKQQNELIKGMLIDIAQTSISINDMQKTAQETINSMREYMADVEELQSAINKDVMSIDIQMEAQESINTRLNESISKFNEKEVKTVEVLTRVVTNIKNLLSELSETQRANEEYSKQALEFIHEKSSAYEKEMSDSMQAGLAKITSLAESTTEKITTELNKSQQLNEENTKQALELIYKKSSEYEQEMNDSLKEGMSAISGLAESTMDKLTTEFKESQRISGENTQQTLNAIQEQSKEYQQKLTEITKQELSKVIELVEEAVGHMSNASSGLSQISKGFNKELAESLDRTFDSFDGNLAEITQHLSGTISGLKNTIEEIDDVTERVPKVISQAYEGMQSSLSSVDNSFSNMVDSLKQLESKSEE